MEPDDNPIVESDRFTEDNPIIESDTFTEEVKELYRNKIFVMPHPKPFSTIFEMPRKYKNEELVFSKRSFHRRFDFPEGCWYRVSEAKRKQRAQKAKRNGFNIDLTENMFADAVEVIDKALEKC